MVSFSWAAKECGLFTPINKTHKEKASASFFIKTSGALFIERKVCAFLFAEVNAKDQANSPLPCICLSNMVKVQKERNHKFHSDLRLCRFYPHPPLGFVK